MGDYDATILELALLGGDNPTIRTGDGRTLRRECSCECHKGVLRFHSVVEGICKVCQGRGWLPVGEDTAVVVIIEYAHEQQDGGHLLEAICEGLWRTPEVPAAVFAAALKAASG